MTVSYNPATDEWVFVNANDLPISAKQLRSAYNIAKHVRDGFTHQVAAFETRPYAFKDAAEAKNCIRLWKQKPEMQKIHVITTENATVKDATGNGLLFLAVRANSLDVVKELIAYGAKVDELRLDGVTSLDAAVPYTEIFQELILHTNNLDSILLYEAAVFSAVDTAKLLLKKGINPNAKHNGSWTPLKEAISHGDENFVNTLITDSRTNLTFKLNDATPLEYAIQENHYNIVILISRAECKKIAALKPNKNDSLDRCKALNYLQKLAIDLKDENEIEIEKCHSLDEAFYIFSTLENLAKSPILTQLDPKSKRNFKEDINKAYKCLSRSDHAKAGIHLHHLIFIHSKAQLERLQKNMMRIKSEPGNLLRTKVISLLDALFSKASKNPNEESITNLTIVYELFIQIDQLETKLGAPYSIKKKGGIETEEIKQKINGLYLDVLNIKDFDYSLTFRKLKKYKQFVRNRQQQKPDLPGIITITGEPSRGRPAGRPYGVPLCSQNF